MPNDEEILEHPEQPRFLLGPWLWAVALFIFFGGVAAIVFVAMPRGPSYEEKRAQARMEKLKTAREQWAKAENSYGWVDEKKGVAHVPIARAMTLATQDLQSKKVTAAGPIATPAPEVPPVTATGAAQPSVPPVTASSPNETSQQNRTNQPAAALNPPNAPPGTQPGASATPAARPNAGTQMPPVTPSGTPSQKAPGTPLPVRGASATPSPAKP